MYDIMPYYKNPKFQAPLSEVFTMAFCLILLLALHSVLLTYGQQSCTTENGVRLAGGGFYYGTLEICKGGTWLTTCSPPNDQELAEVVCRQLELIPLVRPLSRMQNLINCLQELIGDILTQQPMSYGLIPLLLILLCQHTRM